MMSNEEIKKQSKRYILQAGLLCIILTLIVLGADAVFTLNGSLTAPAIVSAVFCLAIAITFALLWKWVATKHKENLPQLFTATTGFRMLLALFTLTGCYFCVGAEAITTYIVVFMAFYLTALVHHAAFFAHITNKN